MSLCPTPGRAPRIAAAIVALVGGCARDEKPPLPEAIVVVDTDLPVPRVVTRLRIDLYAEDGTWFATRDDPRPDPRDWPTSFGVFTDDEDHGRVVYVRLRAYPDARVVRYTGAIHASRRDLFRALPRGDGTPRLVVDGVDTTPATEPDPRTAVDRVVRVRLSPGRRGPVRVVLHGACAGIVVTITPTSDASSCVDADVARPVEDSAIEDDGDDTGDTDRHMSEAGSYARQACEDQASGNGDRVCVEGGSFVFGDTFYRPSFLDDGTYDGFAANPERIVAVSRFVVDRDEVTVGRYRAALERGFVAPSAVGVSERDGALGGDATKACTFSAASRGREDYPLSCITWETARAFCAFEGGDLPTEAQWEYLTLASARPRKTTFSWGDETPTCERAIFARSFVSEGCIALGEGPQPVGFGADVTPSGVRNLVGSMEEQLRDNAASLTDDCWLDAPRIDPSCTLRAEPPCDREPDSIPCRGAPALQHVARGGSWRSNPFDLVPVRRDMRTTVRAATPDSSVGVRCVYPAH